MPPATVWLLRAALLHLGLGASLGAWLLGAKGGALPPLPPFLVASHGAILLLGWLAQCTIGVAYWILPRLTGNPARGPEWVPWVTLGLLNLGVVVTAGGPLLGAAAVPAGLVLALAGAATFAAGMAPRIKPFGAG